MCISYSVACKKLGLDLISLLCTGLLASMSSPKAVFHGLKRIGGASPIDDGLLLGPDGPHLMEHEAAAQHAETSETSAKNL